MLYITVILFSLKKKDEIYYFNTCLSKCLKYVPVADVLLSNIAFKRVHVILFLKINWYLLDYDTSLSLWFYAQNKFKLFISHVILLRYLLRDKLIIIFFLFHITCYTFEIICLIHIHSLTPLCSICTWVESSSYIGTALIHTKHERRSVRRQVQRYEANFLTFFFIKKKII